MKDGNFFGSKVKGSSQFWQGLHKIKHLFKWGAIFKVKNGRLCRFLQDCWVLDVPFKVTFDDPYSLVRNQENVVADCWEDNEWFVDFKRALSVQEFDRWRELISVLGEVSLSNESDIVLWVLDKTKTFSTKSLYRFISDRGVASKVAGYIWKCKVPLKIQFFSIASL